MAERPSAKRGKTSEAEAKPSSSAMTSKRIRMDEETASGASADSTTISLHGDELRLLATAGQFVVTGSEVDQGGSSAVPAELMQPGENNPSSTSEDGPLPYVNRPETSHVAGALPSISNHHSSDIRNSDHTAVVSSVTADAGLMRSPHSVLERMTGGGNGDPVDSQAASVVPCNSRPGTVAGSASVTKGIGDGLGPQFQTDGAVSTTAIADRAEAPGTSCDGRGDEAAGGEGIPKFTATQKEPLRGLREVDVGIVEYISKHKGFHGVIKQRYQDFLVNEVDYEGNVVHLTDMNSPDPPIKISISIDDVLAVHDQQRLHELAASTDKNASHCIEVQDLEKDERKKIHEVIRQDFASLESCTLDGDGKKVIKVTKVIRGGRKQRSMWDKSRPNFCRFVMHKENMEVNNTLSLISKYLHVKQHSFGFSGIKDKRAITVQEVTVYRVEADRLSRLNCILRGIRLGNFRYVKEPLTLGNHSGNHFVIVLRDVEGCQMEMDHALASMRDMGFINYYGMQRFGNSQVATYLVGRAVLHNDWKEAVDLILKPREANTQDNRWREVWMETRDARAVLDTLPRHKTISIEMQLLEGLRDSNNNYLKGMQCITRNVRLLYVHSYQSYIWNIVATRRIRKYGLRVIEGDLILKESQPGDETEQLQTSVIDGALLDTYCIQDIVLPLPGYAVQYPQNELGDWYGELLRIDGLDIDKLRHQVKDYSLAGAYRKIVVKPDAVSWTFLPYSDTTIPLALSDLDRLEGKSLPSEEPGGTLRALRLEFTLPNSCYATMALREVLKADTSPGHQGMLNPVRQTEMNASCDDPVEAESETT